MESNYGTQVLATYSVVSLALIHLSLSDEMGLRSSCRGVFCIGLNDWEALKEMEQGKLTLQTFSIITVKLRNQFQA